MTYLQPILAVILVVLAIGAARRSRRITLIGAGALLFVSWPPTVFLLTQTLEVWYSRHPPAESQAAAIVLLSGGVMEPQPPRTFPLAGLDTYQRTMYAAWLHHKLHNAPVLVCGGNPGPPHTESFAATMKQLLVAAGVRPELIWLEERSRSTYENALFGAALLREKQIRNVTLVTEAYHMPRAERCFRKQGLDVIPAPCAFRRFDFTIDDFIPGWSSLRDTELILHETAGLAWYWLRGRI